MSDQKNNESGLSGCFRGLAGAGVGCFIGLFLAACLVYYVLSEFFEALFSEIF